MEEKQLLNEYRKTIPFLRYIPDSLYFAIDPIGYVVPKGIVARARKELEEKLGHYVMSYDRSIFKLDIPLQAHLCALLKGAVLTENQKQILKTYEDDFRDLGVSFVVYQKPLMLLDPKQSILARLYKERGLLV